MSVFVTGHRGFIGREIVRHLRAAAMETRVLETTGGTPIRLGEPDSVAAILQHCPPAEIIVHCAADIHRSPDVAAAMRTNCLGVEQILEAAKHWQTRRLIFLSSTAVYAPSAEPIDETSPLGPSDAYAASKLYGEHRFLATGSALCLRIPSPVGLGTPENRLVTRWVRRVLAGQSPDVLGAGGKVQHYVDIRDIARAVALAVEKQEVYGVFNIAGARPASNLQLAQLCLQTLRSGLGIEFVPQPDPDDGKSFTYRTEKIAAALSFQPRFTLAESITAIATDRENPAHF